jgi:diguanylate cyclase (GGDEF)-like protein
MKLSFKIKAIIIGGVLAFSVIGAAVLETYLDYCDTESRAYKASTDVTSVVENQINDTFQPVQKMINVTASTLKDAGNINSAKSKEIYNDLKADCELLTGCYAVIITDTNGDVVLDTGNLPGKKVNVKDREYFKDAMSSANGELVIGPAVVARMPNSPIVFHLAQAVYSKSGKVLGVIAISMKPNHLTGFYSLLGFGFSPAISVYKRNGELVSRNPDQAKYVGFNNSKSEMFTKYLKISPNGTYESRSPLDQKVRLAAYRSVKSYKDLIIFAGVEYPVAFKQWEIRAIRVASIIGTLFIITLIAFYLAYRSMLQTEALQVKNERLDELTNIDDLTGIGNRRIFETTLKQEWSRYKRNKVNLAVMLIDVDYFKPYNDNYGHPEGDKTLRKVAQALKKCIHRPTDLVARYGGEEFVVILNADEPGAELIAESIRAKIESLAIKHEFSEVSKVITVSIGLASTSHTNIKSPESLIKEADIALYKAKNEGRNRISVFKSNDIVDKKNS